MSERAADRAGDSARGEDWTAIPAPLGDSVIVTAHAVNRGTHGMASRVRWAFSPDSQTLLVEENPVGVENEPVPDGFLLARDDGAFVQRDSVWDVAPNPDWSLVAFSRAYTAFSRTSDTLLARDWTALAARVGLRVAEVRRDAFHSSGMSGAIGAGRPYVVELQAGASRDAPAGAIVTRALPLAGVWRLAWSDSGGLLAVGAPGPAIEDDAPAERWTWIIPESGQHAAVSANIKLRRTRTDWVKGPSLGASIAVDTASRVVRASPVDVRSEGGRVVRIEHSSDGREARRDIGPGVALAATRGARVILALRPLASARPRSSTSAATSWQLVVYRIVTP